MFVHRSESVAESIAESRRFTRFAVAVTPAVLALALVSSSRADSPAQHEVVLKRTFEGQYVKILVDMPGTSDGIEVWPHRTPAVKFPDVAKRLKKYGTAVKRGDEVLVTKMKIGGHHVEFQLGGGGYGTFADALGGPQHTSAVYQGKTAEEKHLKDQINGETDSKKKKELERQLRDLERERARENAQSQADAAMTNNAAEAQERELRLSGGSRFVLRFDKEVPEEYMTAEGVMKALADYVDFSPAKGLPSSGDKAAASDTDAAGGMPTLKKGMTIEQVEKILGPASGIETEMAAGLEVMVRTYSREGEKVVAKFASGVLVDFTITPN